MIRFYCRRLLYFFRQHQHDRELVEELEAHRSMLQERFARLGVPANEAAHASRRALGNLTLTREEARHVWIWRWRVGVPDQRAV